MTGWISDVFRLGWGALVWNTRKSAHRLRGGRRRCPCQTPSDSGLADETGCEAVTHFRSPARFRVACPLLRRRGDGAWVCSVNSEDTRPFWGRAFLLFGGASAAAYLAATLLAFCGLLAIGYRPTYRQVAWPRAWSELRGVQARLYLERGREALAAGRHAEALLALANAYELDPADYPSGLLLAQLWQGGRPAQANSLFARLYREHPERREQTARIWYRALLARGDFAAVLPLARDRLLAVGEGPPPPAWTQACLFAARRASGPDALARLLEAPRLAPALRPLLELESRLPTADAATRVRLLADAVPLERDAFVAHHLLRRLLEEKRPDLVLSLASAPDSPLSDREKLRLRLDALADLGRQSERSALVRQLLARPPNPAIWELLSSHLIARPDRDLLRLVAEHHRSAPLPAHEAAYPQFLAWFAACGVNGDPESLDEAERLLSASAARDPRALPLARRAFLGPPETFRLETILPLLQPLPLESAYALHDRFSPPRPLPE